MAHQYDGFDIHQHRHQRCVDFRWYGWKKHRARHVLQVSHVQTQRTVTDTRKALTETIRGCRTQSRGQVLGDDEEVSGGLNTSMTIIAHAESSQHLRHSYVDLRWSTCQETEPTPTSAEIQRAVTGCDWHRSPSTSRRNVRAARNNTHIDEILRAATWRSL